MWFCYVSGITLTNKWVNNTGLLKLTNFSQNKPAVLLCLAQCSHYINSHYILTHTLIFTYLDSSMYSAWNCVGKLLRNDNSEYSSIVNARHYSKGTYNAAIIFPVNSWVSFKVLVFTCNFIYGMLWYLEYYISNWISSYYFQERLIFFSSIM